MLGATYDYDTECMVTIAKAKAECRVRLGLVPLPEDVDEYFSMDEEERSREFRAMSRKQVQPKVRSREEVLDEEIAALRKPYEGKTAKELAEMLVTKQEEFNKTNPYGVRD